MSETMTPPIPDQMVQGQADMLQEQVPGQLELLAVDQVQTPDVAAERTAERNEIGRLQSIVDNVGTGLTVSQFAEKTGMSWKEAGTFLADPTNASAARSQLEALQGQRDSRAEVEARAEAGRAELANAQEHADAWTAEREAYRAQREEARPVVGDLETRRAAADKAVENAIFRRKLNGLGEMGLRRNPALEEQVVKQAVAEATAAGHETDSLVAHVEREYGNPAQNDLVSALQDFNRGVLRTPEPVVAPAEAPVAQAAESAPAEATDPKLTTAPRAAARMERAARQAEEAKNELLQPGQVLVNEATGVRYYNKQDADQLLDRARQNRGLFGNGRHTEVADIQMPAELVSDQERRETLAEVWQNLLADTEVSDAVRQRRAELAADTTLTDDLRARIELELVGEPVYGTPEAQQAGAGELSAEDDRVLDAQVGDELDQLLANRLNQPQKERLTKVIRNGLAAGMATVRSLVAKNDESTQDEPQTWRQRWANRRRAILGTGIAASAGLLLAVGAMTAGGGNTTEAAAPAPTGTEQAQGGASDTVVLTTGGNNEKDASAANADPTSSEVKFENNDKSWTFAEQMLSSFKGEGAQVSNLEIRELAALIAKRAGESYNTANQISVGATAEVSQAEIQAIVDKFANA